MGGKKKFTKDNSQTFALVHRSQKELLAHEPDAIQRILVPRGQSVTPEKEKKIKNILPSEVLPSKEVKEPHQPLFFEVDSDVDEALENPDEFEELPDEFIKLAEKKSSSRAPRLDDIDDEEEEFQQYVEEFDGEIDEDNFSGALNDIDDDDEDDEDDDKPRRKGQQVQMTEDRELFEKRFEQVVKDYKEENIGELDEEDDALQGTANIDQFEDVLDEFLESTPLHSYDPEEQERQERLREKKKIISIVAKSDQDKKEAIWVEEEEEDDEKWDCESIVSTYSNLDNHPSLIKEPESSIKKIQLGKSGVPVGAVPKKKKEPAPTPAVEAKNLGEPRKKDESNEEKKLRKQQIKGQRKNNRERKKALKEAFKSEEQSQHKVLSANPMVSTIKVQ